MVTGDNPETARAVAKEAGILQGGSVITGNEFRLAPKDGQVTAAQGMDVMALGQPMG